MDKKPISIGNGDFKDLIESNSYYVDKTKFIEELSDKTIKVYLFPRPRRFGKTLNMSMLDNFFNIEKKEANKDLFKGLYISTTETYKELNSYPTIFISFKELKQRTFESVYNQFVRKMQKLYSSKDYVIDILDDAEKEFYRKIQFGEGNIDDYKDALGTLIDYLARYHGKKVILLIDEYDVPIQEGYLNDYYDEVIDLIKFVFSSSLKDNENLKMGVITGVLRVSKESIFSDINNLKVYGIHNSNFGEYFGFTEEETKELLEYYDLALTKEVKDMYDGYNFNGVEIYNPWSIINYASDHLLDIYWANTSGNDLVKKMLSKGQEEVKETIEKLVQGESCEFTYNEKLTYQDFDKYDSRDVVLNLLFLSGYLTIDKRIDVFKAYLKIPNDEVKELIIRIMKENVLGDYAYLTSDIRKAIDSFDMNKLERALNNRLPMISYNDYKENGYHMYLVGIFSECLGGKSYIVKSNREAGTGRYDVMIEKVDRSFGYIFEFKVAKTVEEMEDTASRALSQIEEKEYYKELVLDKVKDIHKVTIVFSGKKCIVR